MKRLTMLALALIGCGEANEELPTECDVADRRGTYLVQYTQTDGNCGPLPDELVILPAEESDVAAVGCAGEQRVSSNECRVDTELECDDGSKVVGYSIAQDETGHELRGKITLTGIGCRSTYEVVWTRE